MGDVEGMTFWSRAAKYVFRIGAFLLACVLVLSGTAELLRDKSGDEHILRAGTLETETEWDVVFSGSSRVRSSMLPMRLWKEYGFTSFNNAQSGETIPVNYWTCKSVIRRCAPKVLVLDASMLNIPSTYYSVAWTHQSLDPLPAIDRIPAVLDLAEPEDREELLMPLSLYHTRWKNLLSSDFEDADYLLKGSTQDYLTCEDGETVKGSVNITDEVLEPGETPKKYLDSVVDLCNANDVELLLVFLPYFTNEDIESLEIERTAMPSGPKYANWVEVYAEDKEIPCINFYRLLDGLNFDFEKNMYDMSHVNYWGGILITDYMGQYLTEHYDLPDRREDPDYQNWNEDLEEYEAFVEKRLLAYQQTVTKSNTPVFILPDLPEKKMITREEYGDWTANQGVWLDRYNDIYLEGSDTMTLPAGTETVELYGWALDFWNEAPMKEIYLRIGETVLKCEYGLERTDVAERFGNERLRNCGFSITFPASLLGEDIHEVSFIGVSADGQYLYEPVTYQLSR